MTRGKEGLYLFTDRNTNLNIAAVFLLMIKKFDDKLTKLEPIIKLDFLIVLA